MKAQTSSSRSSAPQEIRLFFWRKIMRLLVGVILKSFHWDICRQGPSVKPDIGAIVPIDAWFRSQTPLSWWNNFARQCNGKLFGNVGSTKLSAYNISRSPISTLFFSLKARKPHFLGLALFSFPFGFFITTPPLLIPSGGRGERATLGVDPSDHSIKAIQLRIKATEAEALD